VYGKIRVHLDLAILDVVQIPITPPVEIPILCGEICQIRDLGVQIVFGTDVGSWGEVTGNAT
jgi:hypothetical protein